MKTGVGSDGSALGVGGGSDDDDDDDDDDDIWARELETSEEAW